MASSGDLARAVADSAGLELSAVLSYIKSLRENHLISLGGCGVSTATMGITDVAALLTGILSDAVGHSGACSSAPPLAIPAGPAAA